MDKVRKIKKDYELQFCKLDTPYVTGGSSYDRQTRTETERHCLSKINN